MKTVEINEILYSTPCGMIKGTLARQPGAVAFKGIRYARAKRWQYPEVVTKWEGTYDATHYGPCALQQRAYMPETATGRVFYYHEFRENATFTYDEDCQYLNVFAPKDIKNAPVIVYIHGGALLGGSSDELCFDEPVWTRDGVVAVTINYRLGPLGFACFEKLAAVDGHTGNYGLYDQLAALQWVHNNIASFGGNPDNITIMGQSAGAMSVQHIISSPLAKGLVHKGVLSSGGGRGRMFGKEYSREHFYPFWKEVMRRAKADSLEDLRTMDAKNIFDAFGSLLGENFAKNREACNFVVDGAAMPFSIHEAADKRLYMDIPYMIGSNSEDMDPSSMNLDAQEWAQEQKTPSYAYLFSRQLPGDTAGAFHSADLWYWFGTLNRCWRPFAEYDKQLSVQMERYLTNFAATGDPNGDDLPKWEVAKSSRSLLHFGDTMIKMEEVEPSSLTKEAKVKGW